LKIKLQAHLVSLIDDSYTEEMQTINSITDRILKDIKENDETK